MPSIMVIVCSVEHFVTDDSVGNCRQYAMNAAKLSSMPTRKYHSPLREAQAGSTRTHILDTMARMLAQGDTSTFSVKRPRR